MKMNAQLWAQWEEIERRLREARQQLDTGSDRAISSKISTGWLTEALAEFENFLDHNELELAWDVLCGLANRMNASANCWNSLARAASLMELSEKENEAAQRAGNARL